MSGSCAWNDRKKVMIPSWGDVGAVHLSLRGSTHLVACVPRYSLMTDYQYRVHLIFTIKLN